MAFSAGRCPGNHKSAGRRRSGKTRNGSKWLDYALEEAAMAAIRVRDGYLAAKYRAAQTPTRSQEALGAVKHTLICATWHMLSTGETYRELGGDYFTNRDPERRTSAASVGTQESSRWRFAVARSDARRTPAIARACARRHDRDHLNKPGYWTQNEHPPEIPDGTSIVGMGSYGGRGLYLHGVGGGVWESTGELPYRFTLPVTWAHVIHELDGHPEDVGALVAAFNSRSWSRCTQGRVPGRDWIVSSPAARCRRWKHERPDRLDVPGRHQRDEDLVDRTS